MKSRFHEAAEAELTEAVAYYDAQAPGLGDRLMAEIKAATRYIEQYPEIAPVIDEGVRAKVLVRFPYSLMYVVEAHELYIVAVAHQSRRPGYWADRLPAGG
jgi:plasmid stabilization system protein ParE